MLDEARARRIYFLRALHRVDDEGLFNGVEPPNETRAEPDESELSLIDRLMAQKEQTVVKQVGHNIHTYYMPHKSLALWLMPLCFLLGLSSNYLGPGEKIDLLANPLVTLIFWNIVIFLFLLGRALARKSEPVRWLPSLLYRMAHKIRVFGGDGPEETLLRKARLQARSRWLVQQPKLVIARLTHVLHRLAIAMVLGALGGLYLRGLARAYQFQWDSTFVSAEGREQVLSILFAPVLALTGGEIPPLDGANGAAWIHLLALATLLYVVLPRLSLALYWHWRHGKLAKSVDIQTSDDFFRKLLARRTTLERQLTLVGYSYRLSDSRQEKLLAAARQLWGQRTRHRESVDVTWGDTEPPDTLEGGQRQLILICFAGAQTPEEEVHTEFARHMLARIQQLGVGQWAVLVDEERVDASLRERRREAWSQVLRAAGVRSICFSDLTLEPKLIAAELSQVLGDV